MKFFLQNRLIKVLSFNAILVFVRFFTGFVAIKAMSILIGPGGIAIVGNFRSFLTGVQSLASLGIRDGLVKFIAEKKDDEKTLKKVISTAMIMVFALSLMVGIAMFLGAALLDAYIFPEASYIHVFKILAFLLPLSVINILLLAVLNGFEAYKKIIFINSMANIFGLGLTLFLMWKLAVEGALLAAVLGEVVIVVLTAVYGRKYIAKRLRYSSFSITFTRGLMQYALMALTTAIVIPGSFILIRNHMMYHLGIEEAGYWEALYRISGIYMLFVTSGLTLYYFPRLSAIGTETGFKNEVINYYKTLVPAFVGMAICIYVLKKWVVLLVLSEEFMAVTSMMIWQLLGDVLKVMSLAFGYQILAKSMVRQYIILEILFGLIFYILSVYFINLFGLSGVVQAYFAAHVIHFVFMLLIFRKTIRVLIGW